MDSRDNNMLSQLDYIKSNILTFLVILLFLMCGLLHHVDSNQPGILKEYCQWEVFNATCPRGEVIVMESAQYGRMELGRCLLRDYGYVGCGVSVLPYVDSRCSGRKSCSVNIPDRVLDKVQPCPGDLKSYMQASFNCIKVSTGRGQFCRAGEPILLTTPTGYIASVVTEDTQLGSNMCPWLIQGEPGQQIVIQLYDFSLWRSGDNPSDKTSSRHSPESSGVCHIYAQLQEQGLSSLGSVTLCGSEERHKTVYTSETNSVKVEVNNMKLARNPSYFILQYQVIGCPDWPKTAGVEIERAKDRLLLRCKATQETVDLKCMDGKWKGSTLNCTEVKAWGLTDFIENAISLPQGILIVLIIGIAMFIAIVILAVGLYTLRRRTNSRKGSVLVPTDQSYTSGRSTDASFIPKEQYPMLANPERCGSERECDYTTTWQRRATVPATAVIRDHSLPPPPREAYESRGLMSRPLSPSQFHYPYRLEAQNQPASSFNSFQPASRPPQVEHIYESPKFERKTYSDGPFYHEFDADGQQTGDNNNKDSPPDLVPDEITYAKDMLPGPGSNWTPPPPPPPPPQFHPGVHGMGASYPR